MEEVYSTELTQSVAAFIRDYFDKYLPKDYVYHDLEHTENVVYTSLKLAEEYHLADDEKEDLAIAAWFHDMGYAKGPENHESRSAAEAEAFLLERKHPSPRIARIKEWIMATKMGVAPVDLHQSIIKDADLSHLGKDIYWERSVKVRQELMVTQGKIMTEKEWLLFELEFLINHSFHTTIAETFYELRKKSHIQQLKLLKAKLFPETAEDFAILKRAKIEKKKSKKKKKASKKGGNTQLTEINLGRGVETMYRATYRTHVNLSSIADNKANIMLSINAIIISITVSTLVPRLVNEPFLTLPTIMLVGTCLLAIIFATLSTRPKITEGKFTRQDIEQKRSNLLFFGNFYNMKFDDFHWGMMEMIQDKDFLYSSMTRDLYYLGVVLAKKYRLLSYCYNIFMYGLIFTVIAFGIVFAIN